jgi:hypothetical protein
MVRDIVIDQREFQGDPVPIDLLQYPFQFLKCIGKFSREIASRKATGAVFNAGER